MHDPRTTSRPTPITPTELADRYTLRELVDQAETLAVMVVSTADRADRDRTGTADLALLLLASHGAIAELALITRPTYVRVAAAYGATVDDIAAAADLTPLQVADQLRQAGVSAGHLGGELGGEAWRNSASGDAAPPAAPPATAGPSVTLVPRDAERRPGRRVWLVEVDGAPIGIVGDERPWRGDRWGSALRWWAALRDGDDRTAPAAWNTGDVMHRTRQAAVDALTAEHIRRGAGERGKPMNGAITHPSWCDPARCRAAADGAHERQVFALQLRQPGNVVDADRFRPGYPPAACSSERASVTLLQFPAPGPAGASPVLDPAEVVLDVPDGVSALTAVEAARLGAALIRASRQLTRDGAR